MLPSLSENPIRRHRCWYGCILPVLQGTFWTVCDAIAAISFVERLLVSRQLGGGIILYLAQEGRGIGLINKLRAYALQDTGLDTLEANMHLGFKPDERDYSVASEMLNDLGIAHIRLLTSNPDKIAALEERGIEVVGRVTLPVCVNPHNDRYLRTKREQAGHLDSVLEN